jgi:hypothetical protein
VFVLSIQNKGGNSQHFPIQFQIFSGGGNRVTAAVTGTFGSFTSVIMYVKVSLYSLKWFTISTRPRTKQTAKKSAGAPAPAVDLSSLAVQPSQLPAKRTTRSAEQKSPASIKLDDGREEQCSILLRGSRIEPGEVSGSIDSFYEADFRDLYSGVAAVETGERCMGVHHAHDFSVGNASRSRMDLLFVRHVTFTKARRTGT